MAMTVCEPKAEEPAKRPQGRAPADSSLPVCKVAILGFGTVGRAVAELLCRNPHPQLRLTHIFNRGVERKWVPWAPEQVRWTDNFDEVLASDVDVVVEVAGGIEPASDWVRRALRAGKSAVTANKHLMATQGAELLQLAREAGQRLEYGASVAGGVPVLCGLEHGLAGEELFRLTGVLNGTCNYILSNMEARDLSFADALAQAQELGYAEANPSDDVQGVDASCKLAILARVGLGAQLHPAEVYCRSIQGVEAVDFAYAKKLGCTIRQVSLAEVKGKQLFAAVQPALVSLTSPLAHTRDNQNALITTGTHGGETVFAGRGAGGGPTSVAVVSDLVAIAQRTVGSRRCGELKAYPVSRDFEFPHYVRLAVRKRVDLGSVTRTFSRHGIEVGAVLPKPSGARSRLPVVMMLEPCRTSVLEAALGEIAELDSMLPPPLSLPVLS